MCDDKKNWDKPLYPKEIAENASNWSFAADLGLLKYLEVFSEDLLDKATTVDNNVNTLLNDLSKASLSLDIARNKFLSLSNTQFIESRVYEDDETAVTNEEKSPKGEPVKNNNEETHKNEMRLAALRGIEVMNKYFDKVQVIDSDSEGDDTDFTSFVLHPKDPYIDRPLPYVIGTDEWNKKLHVGLVDSSSESEEEQASEKFSDTDSETDLPIIDRSQARSLSGSESSEADLSNRLDQPVANSTFNDTNKGDDYLGSSEDSVSAQVSEAQNFAEQLAAKLGNVIKTSVEEPIVNTRPIQKPKNYSRYEDMFSDEPPPLDDYEDELSPKSKDQGIFSGGDGLFDDLNDDEPFWGTGSIQKQEKVSNSAPSKKSPPNDLFEEENEDSLFTDKQKNISKTSQNSKFMKELDGKLKKQKEPSIFDDNDDDLFFANPNKVDRIPFIEPKKEGLFDDDEMDENCDNGRVVNKLPVKDQSLSRKVDDLFEDTKNNNTKPKKPDSLFDAEDLLSADSPKRKALVGGVQVISNPNIFLGQNVKNLLKNKRQSSSESSETEPEKKDEVYPKEKDQRSGDVRKISDFVPPRKDNENNSLFAEEEDGDDDLFKGGLFANFAADKTRNTPRGGLFDDIDEEQSTPSSEKIEESRKAENNTGGGLKKLEDHSKGNESKVKSPPSLFSEHDESDSDDLFSSKQSKIITRDKILESTTITRNEPIKSEPPPVKREQKKAPSLFDDDLDNEDDDLFSSNFLQPKKPSTRKPEKKRKNLFGEEEEDDLFSVKASSKVDDDIFDRSKFFEPTIERDSDVISNKDDFETTEDLAQTKRGSCDEINISRSDKGLISSIGASNRSAERETVDKDVVPHKFSENGESSITVPDEKLGEMRPTSENHEEDRASSRDVIHSIESTDISTQIAEKPIDDVEEPPPDPMEESADVEQSHAENKNEFLSELKSELHQDDSEKNIANASNEDVRQVNGNQTIDVNDRMKNPFSSTADRIPAVHIFDPTPPPDLGDWDTRSEHNIFYDDIYTFDNSDSLSENRSSIFDREPPSVFNESSGIVRDQSAGLENDISSFHPYGSSSRRFSSDLPSEEQSVDSLLVSKNVFHSFEPNIPPSILEDTEDSASTFEITPSGKLEDLYSEPSELKQSKSVTFEDNLFKKKDDALVVEDLDKTQTKEDSHAEGKGKDDKKPKPAVSKKPNLRKNILQDGTKNSEVIKGTVAKKIENIEDHEEKKIEDNIGKIKASDESGTVSNQEISAGQVKASGESEGVPGKLKRNLNINVFALLPGAGKPPKREAQQEKPEVQSRLHRSVSLDISEQDVGDGNTVTTASKALETEPLKVENSIDDVEVLESVTKTRARGPVKRRPSTKRGRDAIRNSCIDFTFTSNSLTEGHKNDMKDVIITEKPFLPNELQPKPLSYESTLEQIDRLVDDGSASEAKRIDGNVMQDTVNILSKNDTVIQHLMDENEKKTENSEQNPKKERDLHVNSCVPSNIDVEEDRNEVLEALSKSEEKSSIFDVNDFMSNLKNVDGDDSNIVKHIEKETKYIPDLPEETEAVIKPKPEKSKPTKRIDFLSDLMSIHNSLDSEIAEPPASVAVVDKSSSISSHKKDLFDDDTDDEADLFSSFGTKSSSRTNVAFKGNKMDNSNDNRNAVFPDEMASEDLFGENKISSKPKVPKNTLFDDEDDDDLFGQATKESHQGNHITTISSRRLKTSSLKKLENVTITGDDPLNALN